MRAIRFLYRLTVRTYINKRGLSSLIPAEEAIPHSYIHLLLHIDIYSCYFHVSSLKSDALHASPNQTWQNGSQKGVVQIRCDNGQTWLWPAVQLGSLSALSSCLSLHPVIWPLAKMTWMSYFVHLHQYFCSLQHVYIPPQKKDCLIFNILKSTAVTQFCFYLAEMIKKWGDNISGLALIPLFIFLMFQ